MYAHIYLVPRPYYCARQIRFGPRSPRIHHRSELTEKAWENAAQGQEWSDDNFSHTPFSVDNH